MIINHIKHHHIDHHHIIDNQDILYNILKLVNFSTKRNCKVSSINTTIWKMIKKMKGWFMEGIGDSLILTIIGEADFLTIIGEAGVFS